MNDDNNYFGDETSYSNIRNDNPKKPEKHNGLRIFTGVLCAAVIGAGSYQVYKFINDSSLGEVSDLTVHKNITERQAEVGDTDESENIEKNNETKEAPPKNTALPSLIQVAAREDAKYLPDIVDEIMPSVVGVSSTFEYTQQYNTWGFMGFQPQTETKQVTGTGTGIVMTDDGYIITNSHVVYDTEYNCGKAIDVSILLSDETEHEAKIIAYDIETDLAVLKIDETGLTPAEFGDSNELRVGELVIAVGNPLGFDLFGSVTSGIVSALNRQISINEKNMTLIQTDAAINSGNSGGPLLNSCGQVIGINSAKMSSAYGSASVEGLGFAIPISDAKVIIDDLINNGYVTGRPQIGITTVDVTEAYSRYLNIPMGVYVQSVQKDSAAEQAGLQIGDVIIDIEGEAVTTAEELNKVKNNYKAGDTITLTVTRAGEDIDIELVLQESSENRDNPLDYDTNTSET
ncbi:MAG: trypsin-like peptidase domain-containing protein [Ruminococcus sp.]|nr:trypsin-like peptidase domain-containing protein [Ruminococcus sp.]